MTLAVQLQWSVVLPLAVRREGDADLQLRLGLPRHTHVFEVVDLAFPRVPAHRFVLRSRDGARRIVAVVHRVLVHVAVHNALGLYVQRRRRVEALHAVIELGGLLRGGPLCRRVKVKDGMDRVEHQAPQGELLAHGMHVVILGDDGMLLLGGRACRWVLGASREPVAYLVRGRRAPALAPDMNMRWQTEHSCTFFPNSLVGEAVVDGAVASLLYATSVSGAAVAVTTTLVPAEFIWLELALALALASASASASASTPAISVASVVTSVVVTGSLWLLSSLAAKQPLTLLWVVASMMPAVGMNTVKILN
jgi:hypothetical protein